MGLDHKKRILKVMNEINNGTVPIIHYQMLNLRNYPAAVEEIMVPSVMRNPPFVALCV